MTRINLVEPSQLTDKHLMAEYRELPRIFTAVNTLVEPNEEKGLRIGEGWTNFMASNQIPEFYCLGKGHCKFFYNKLPWLIERYAAIGYELRYSRKFKLDLGLREDIISAAVDLSASLRGDMIEYHPAPEEIYLNMARLANRSNIEEVLNEIRTC